MTRFLVRYGSSTVHCPTLPDANAVAVRLAAAQAEGVLVVAGPALPTRTGYCWAMAPAGCSGDGWPWVYVEEES